MNVNFQLLRIAIRSNMNEVKANRLHCTSNEKSIEDCTELHKKEIHLRIIVVTRKLMFARLTGRR